jgi:AraC-like DNA-binding protein
MLRIRLYLMKMILIINIVYDAFCQGGDAGMAPFLNPRDCLVFLSSLHKRKMYKRDTLQSWKIPGELIVVVLQGKGLLYIDRVSIQLLPNQIYVLNSAMDIEVMLESSMVEYYVLALRCVEVRKHRSGWSCSLAQTKSDASPCIFAPGMLHLQASRPMLKQLHELYGDRRSRETPARLWQLRFQSLLHFMLQAVPVQEPPEKGGGIDQSIAYMHKHFHEKISLDTLADIAGLTQTSYSRSFKKAKGVSPVEYLNRIRIDSSKQLLEMSSIKEVSGLVGFGNEFYFSRMFKRETGLTPTFYVQRRLLKVAVACCFRFGDNLRSLGVEAAAEMNAYNYMLMELSDSEKRRYAEMELLKLRDARPDIIIADYRHTPFLNQLKQVASTVVLDFTMDWRSNHRKIAELVGREREAQQNFSQLERQISYARGMLANKIGHETVSVMRLYRQTTRIQGLRDHPVNELLYGELGLAPGSCVPMNVRLKEYKLNQLPPLETDYAFVYPYDPAASYDALSSLRQNEFWRGTKACRCGRVHTISNWIGLSWSPGGQQQILDELLHRIQLS